ncbi:hypothetical protein FSC37_01980 [Piscinibacter aquaticus]|uniref:protein O-GlcNAc transferase n=1 Tax=Piscinibacter aquaticus TaxID=392597 RepID=A0A5C6U059_9BURK|nr:hypothetical protein FSC37_01980 [Piscinibacter aquaticus]
MDAATLTRRGVELQSHGRHQEAVQCFMQSLGLKIDDAFTHYRLGVSFRDCGMKLEAAECIRTALALRFDDELFARGLLAYMEREGCRWASAEAEWGALEAALDARPEGEPLQINPFVHAVLSSDALRIRRVAEHYARFFESFVKPLPPVRARAHGGPLRIAYISADFQQHATAQLMVQMLEAHDRERFEVTLVSAGADDGSAMRQRLKRACHRFEDMHGASHDAMARRIRALGVDILIDVKGATDGTLLPVLAARPAPLQLNWLAFPGTSGARFIDYVIGDAIVTPLAHAAHFTEKIAQLSGCYQPNDAKRARPAPASRAEAGLPDGAIVLCGFHQSFKISQTVFDRWCEILQRVPGSVLWLLEWNANVRESLLAAARQQGIAPERLVFAPLLPLERHCPPGLRRCLPRRPALQCPHHRRRGAVDGRAGGHDPRRDLRAARGCEPAAPCRPGPDGLHRRSRLREYRHGAGGRCKPPPRCASTAGQREACALFSGERFARDMERLLQGLWLRACAGQPPAHWPAGNA